MEELGVEARLNKKLRVIDFSLISSMKREEQRVNSHIKIKKN